MSLQWNEKLAVGNDSIDNQHKEIFSRLNGLLDATARGKGKEEIVPLIKFLTDYTKTHFRDEEDIMAGHCYPALSLQREAHKQFVKDLFELHMEFEIHGPTSLLFLRIQRHLGNWLIKHIGSEDKKFGDFLKGTTDGRKNSLC